MHLRKFQQQQLLRKGETFSTRVGDSIIFYAGERATLGNWNSTDELNHLSLSFTPVSHLSSSFSPGRTFVVHSAEHASALQTTVQRLALGRYQASAKCEALPVRGGRGGWGRRGGGGISPELPHNHGGPPQISKRE